MLVTYQPFRATLPVTNRQSALNRRSEIINCIQAVKLPHSSSSLISSQGWLSPNADD